MTNIKSSSHSIKRIVEQISNHILHYCVKNVAVLFYLFSLVKSFHIRDKCNRISIHVHRQQFRKYVQFALLWDHNIIYINTTIFILRQSGTLHIPLNQQPRNAYALRGLISLIICCFILLYTDLNYQQQRINGFLFSRLPCILLWF